MSGLEVVVIFLGHRCFLLAWLYQLCPEISPKERGFAGDNPVSLFLETFPSCKCLFNGIDTLQRMYCKWFGQPYLAA